MWVRPDFDACIAAIVDTVSRRVVPNEPTEAIKKAAAASVLETASKMPDYLRFGFRILVLALDCGSYLSMGKPFHELSFADREETLRRWEMSHLGFKRSLAASTQTLAAFGLFTEIYRKG